MNDSWFRLHVDIDGMFNGRSQRSTRRLDIAAQLLPSQVPHTAVVPLSSSQRGSEFRDDELFLLIASRNRFKVFLSSL
jgi:hypothetical protein